jgi:outer membrane protein TolC
MLQRLPMAALALLLALPVLAQRVDLGATDPVPAVVDEGRELPAVVTDYVREAWGQNLALKSQSFDVARQLALLDEAQSRFFPLLALQARYTVNDGGRQVTIPLGGPDEPPTSFNFLRDKEQDTRLTLRQPLYAPAIPAAYRAEDAQLAGVQYARVALARRLERDLTVGYLDWLRARNSVAIAGASLELLAENLRVNESLYANGKITQDQVLRARSELLEVKQQKREIENLEARAQQFVNFLLNRDLDGALELAAVGRDLAPATTREALRTEALANRPELKQLDQQVRAADFRVSAARAARQPQLSAAVDGGFEGAEYRVESGIDSSRVQTASLLLSWTLFDGGTIRSRIDSARATARQLATQREDLARQIELDVQQALDRLVTAEDSLATAEARVEAARAGFRIASRKRDQGAINQVEFIDARSALTSAEQNLNLTRFALLSRQAELAYATGSGLTPLPAGGP